MISFDPDKKRFGELKEVSAVSDVNRLLDDGFVLLEAGLVKGKRFFLLGKEKISLVHPPSLREQEQLVDEAVHAMDLPKLGSVHAMPDWLSGLLGMGVGLWLVMVGSVDGEPFLGWGILVRLVGVSLVLIGLVQLVMYVLQSRHSIVRSVVQMD